MKGKMRTFVGEHKDDIVGWTIVIGSGLVGYKVAKKRYSKVPNGVKINYEDFGKAMEEIFNDIPDGTVVDAYLGRVPKGFKPEEMGKLGKRLISEGGRKQKKIAYTHFIMVGERK